MPSTPLELVAVFKAAGWRYPLRLGDGVEVWKGPHCLGTVPTLLLLQLLGHYIQGAMLQDHLGVALTRVKPPSHPPLRHTAGRRLRGRS